MAKPAAQVKILVPGHQPMVALLGQRDSFLKLVESAFDSEILVRGNEITISGPEVEAERVARIFEELLTLLEKGLDLSDDSVGQTIALVKGGLLESESDAPGSPAPMRASDVLGDTLLNARGKGITPRTIGQKRYVDAIRSNTVTFAIGPAGTGKTYLAVATAVRALHAREVSRLILTRPAVEAGERLGFLPGTLYEKIDPYMRPLYDALFEMTGADTLPRLMERGTIEVAPLAFMRGRAQPYERRVLTPTGFRAIGELAVGDLVTGSNGQPTPVLGVYPQGRTAVFQVRAQDGASTICCGEHLWAVTTPDDRRRGKPSRVVETQEMIGRLRQAHNHRFELPLLSRPVEFEPHEVPMDPYALGLLLGDGGERNELPRQDELDVPMTSARRYSGTKVANRVATKFVPDSYLHNTPAVRLAVLQGLLDTDGGPVPQRGRTCHVQYCTSSPRLRDDVVFLVRSLGGVACFRARRHGYVLDIRLPRGIEPFRLTRKRWTYKAMGGGGRPMRFIDSIEPAGEQETICIQVAAADSLYVTDDFLVTHNTLNDAFILLDEAQNTTPEQMKMFLTRIGFGSKAVVNGDATQVDLPSGQSSGLHVVEKILSGIEGIAFCQLGGRDVVRHRIVQDIVEAYGRAGDRQARVDG